MGLEIILDQLREIKPTINKGAVYRDKEGVWPESNIQLLKELGFAGLVVPKEIGGHGQGLYALARSSEILAQACPSTAMCFGMHHVGTAVLSAKATPFQQEKYLEPIAQGKHLTTLALSEPGSGAHLYFPQTKLETLPNEELKISGTKTFVTNGGYADSYVASTVAVDSDAEPFQFSCVVLDSNQSNLKWGAPWEGFGMRGNASRSLEILDAVIPSNQLLGAKGDQLWFIFHVVAPYFLTAMAGTYLGIAEAAFEEARNHLKTRTYAHSGSSLGESPILQHRIGVLWSKVERTRQLVYTACREGDKGSADSMPAIMAAKAEVAVCVTDVVNEAMTLTGGIGYSENGMLGRLLRDARAAHVMTPTTDLLYTWIGRTLLDQPIISD